ncbi:LytR/AlgR family response regulator transcription factor [Dyadobacter tibetensis]|uniref:LytR/AlgR family response regulator transcription factor n=1 Tax=Dyadobacter tibetensis TaxID=1211851 RepID=UPI00046FDF9D|nr:LytTR family DNA-binding domain-containing protein [Dyadobacter tibetensis]
MKLKTILVDDEPHALAILATYLENFGEIEIVAHCQNAIQAFQILQRSKIDLMFLDIQMPDLKGTDFLRSLKNPPKVIFTTAYIDYAVEGFDLNAIDYLLKPISFDRFLKAIDKTYTLFEIQNRQISIGTKSTDKQQEDIFIYLKVDRKTIKVNLNDILWIESIRDYVKLILIDKVLVSKQRISVIEELLPEDKFIRIHRSFIVSLAKIQGYHSFGVDIAGKELPIGRSYKADFQRRFRIIY